MRKTKTILSAGIMMALLAIIMIGGCKKKDDTPVTPTGKERIKTFKGQASVFYTDSIEYDASLRQSVYWSSVPKVVYTYNGNTVIKEGQDAVDIYNLNSQGYATSKIYRSYSGGITIFDTYTYDADGHMLTHFSTDSLNYSRDTIIQTWSGGNMTSSYHGAANDLSAYYFSELTTYTYLTDKISTIENENFGKLFLGKGSKNLINTISIVNAGVTTLNYEYDTKGRVKKQTGIPANSLYSAEYTYY